LINKIRSRKSWSGGPKPHADHHWVGRMQRRKPTHTPVYHASSSFAMRFSSCMHIVVMYIYRERDPCFIVSWCYLPATADNQASVSLSPCLFRKTSFQ
jgi:hypothetical protein